MLTYYEAMGGEDTIRKLVESFYPKVLAHPLLAPIFPEEIEPVMDKQFDFLVQFFGGPHLYTAKYGRPMMRARHLPFPITPSRAEAWLECMRQALDEVVGEPELRKAILQRLTGPAHHFVNSEETNG